MNTRDSPTRSLRLRSFLVMAIALTGIFASQARAANTTKRECVYAGNSIGAITSFAAMTGRNAIDCTLVYGGGTDWQGWSNPWYLHVTSPDQNYAKWVQASPPNDRRQLIVDMPLIPTGLVGTNWEAEGAAGTFEPYATQLAQNLVSSGVGDAIIVLGPEANGNWEPDWIGASAQDMSQWVQFWRNTVQAMRAVPGAAFQFVWAVNNRFSNVPFASYYPGDDVVDIIGDDAYDSAVTADSQDWSEVYNSPAGLGSLVAFARAHGKPIALPEWGVGVRNSGNLAGGDDPAYVNGIATVVADNATAFQCYFDNHEWATQLQSGPSSLAAYRAAFGDSGYALGANNGMAFTSTAAPTQPIGTAGASPTRSTTAGTPTKVTVTTSKKTKSGLKGSRTVAKTKTRAAHRVVRASAASIRSPRRHRPKTRGRVRRPRSAGHHLGSPGTISRP